MTVRESQGNHVLALAKELLEDLELSRTAAEGLLLKAARLARFAGTEEDQDWIALELTGYHQRTATAKKYLALTGRWIDREKQTAYWGPLAQQEGAMAAIKLQLASTSTQGLGGEGVAIAVSRISSDLAVLRNEFTRMSGVRSRVLGLLHGFVMRVYYEQLLSGAANTIFDRFQAEVDALLASTAGDALAKLPAVFDRLAAGDQEAISQAMNSLRRSIEAFADAVFPPSVQPVTVEGQEYKVSGQHHQNRIYLYVAGKCESSSRRKRLRQAVTNVHERVCAGVHDDISLKEAQALVLSVYLILGEIANL